MRTFWIIALAATWAQMALAAPTTYGFDTDHTEVRFYWNHAGVSQQSGEWRGLRGSVTFDPDRIEATRVTVTIDPGSVDTGVSGIDDFLTGRRMFDARRYPEITFVSTSARQTGPETAVVRGQLTIKGKTEPLELTVRMNHQGTHPIARFLPDYGGNWLGVQVEGQLFRSLFGMDYGYPLVSDAIRLEISAELQAQPGG